MNQIARILIPCVLIAGSLAHPAIAQAQTFASVEIRNSAPNTIQRMRTRFSGGSYALENASMAELIGAAWGVDPDSVVGGPEWIGTNRLDVLATAPPDSSSDALHAMLRELLEDRFHVVVHKGQRDIPAYALTAGKKVQLTQSSDIEEGGCSNKQAGNSVVTACRNMTMTAFAAQLPRLAAASTYLFNYPVVDRTGLQGAWNFDFQWTPRRIVQKGEAISLFDALRNGLGLTLRMSKIPSAVLLVEKVEQPSNLSSATPAAMKFEVATVKPSAQNEMGSFVGIQPGGSVRIGMTLKGLIQEAWGDLNPERIVGAPKSANSSHWTVEARTAAFETGKPGWNGAVWEGLDLHSMRMMLRALLVERFHLEAHVEQREVSGYALVAAKPRLQKADPGNRPGCIDGPGRDGKDPRNGNSGASQLITCRNMTLSQFADALSAWSPEDTILFGFPPVVDGTALNGRFDMTINFTPPRVLENIAAQGVPPSEPNGTISIFEALRDQLGLKLEARKVTTQVLVIDHVDESPTEN